MGARTERVHSKGEMLMGFVFGTVGRSARCWMLPWS